MLFSDLIDALPDHLRERTRAIRDAARDDHGELVLCWLHHAVRGHENPAIDVAAALALRLGRPLLVYQGLGGRHRFNSDRHHAFIMQGARDAQAELAARGIRHVFSLPTDPDAPAPITALARRSAVIVTEDFPAPPMPGWTRALGERSGRPVLAVDAACVVPMQAIGVPHGEPITRAFKFRSKAQKLFTARAGRPYAEANELPEAFGGDIGFASVDLASADIAGLIAACEIDHGSGPIADTIGGSAAGYARWEAFKRTGLARYAACRNDAATAGVSRMSPYLHHGQVSPLRIVREALAFGGDGAEKFIDELWVWRELAHHFCFHRVDELERVSILPQWAQATLSKHAGDRREAIHPWETLHRAQTGDALWDLCQQSLLVRGELHNNTRMTWGKRLLDWTKGPGEALGLLIDLNHREALDGNDPSSYGGLLWCLGQFDRPFDPEAPIIGTVRPRATADHARRLDMQRYERLVSTPPGRRLRVGIVGGGVSGMACARTLADRGHEAIVFDKGRGPGGRCSTRRTDDGPFDRGAQYFTARDPRFRQAVESWRSLGVCDLWLPRLVAIGPDGTRSPKQVASAGSEARFVGTPGMNAIVRHLVESARATQRCEVHFEAQVSAIAGSALLDEQGAHLGSFDAIVLAIPAPQARTLVGDRSPALAARLDAVEIDPCWAAMLVASDGADAGLADPGLADPGFDAAFVNEHPVLAWLARDSAKPGRAGEPARWPARWPTRWVAHASADWSREHLEDDREASARALADAFTELTGQRVERATAHRWRYAQPRTLAGERCLWDEAARLGACGDWCSEAKIQGAYLSGVAMAGRLLALAARG